jgi:hypothetical protein
MAMSLPAEIGSHHTMWFTVGAHQPVAVRYAVDNDEVVCLGDGNLNEVNGGDTLVGIVHEIAGGPPLLATSFAVRVRPSETIPLFVVGEVIGHVSPRGSWEKARSEHRFLSLNTPMSHRTI